MEQDTTGSDAEGITKAEEVESISEEAGWTYLPEFLSESQIGGDWSINVKMANAIQADNSIRSAVLRAIALIISSRTAPKQKMAEGPKSRWDLTKTSQFQ